MVSRDLETLQALQIVEFYPITPLMHLVHSRFSIHNGNNYGSPAAKSAYEKHCQTIRFLVPQGRLREIDTEL